MAYKYINYEKKNKVAIVTLNRPEVLNAINFEMSDEIVDAFTQANDDNEVNVILLTGTGRAFQVGADVRSMDQLRRQPGAGSWAGFQAPRNSMKPIVCAVNGQCGGGGLTMACDSDVVICSDDSTFFDPHVDVAAMPHTEPASFMPLHEAMRIALMGVSYRMSAERAYQLGLVSEVLPHDKLMERAVEIAEVIASKAPLATRWYRWNVRHIMIEGPQAAAQAEINRWVDIHDTPDGREGPRSFVEKRAPKYTGEGGPKIRRQRRR